MDAAKHQQWISFVLAPLPKVYELNPLEVLNKKNDYHKYKLNSCVLPEMSAHSGDENEYLPSIIFLNIIICFLCQNGGQPTNLKTKTVKNSHFDFFCFKYSQGVHNNTTCPSVTKTIKLINPINRKKTYVATLQFTMTHKANLSIVTDKDVKIFEVSSITILN